MRVTLVRHTQPAVSDGVCYGATDLDVAPTFEAEAAQVVEALPPAMRLCTSPLRRCRRLAERIGAAQGLTPAIDERLREMDLGAWEGVAWDDIPRAELDAWAADFLHARPHGGENVYMLRERIWAAIDDYRRSGLSHIVVTHHGIIKAALARNGDPEAWKTHVDFGGSIRLPNSAYSGERNGAFTRRFPAP